MRGIFKAVRVGTIVAVLVGLCATLISCVSLCKPPIYDFDEEEYGSAREAYYKAFAAYFYVIRMNDPTLVNRIPKKVVDPQGYRPKTVHLRQNAADFFKRTKGRALVGVAGAEIAALEPDELLGGVLNNPAELTVWHNTGHYSGVHISVEDDNGRILAGRGAAEISHYQTVLRRDEIKMPYAEPTTPAGSIKVYSWSLEYSSGMPQPFLEMRVKFPGYREEKWRNIDTTKLKLFFEQQRLYKMAIYEDYRRAFGGLLPDDIPDPLTGKPVHFRKSIIDVAQERFDRVWQYGPLMADIRPCLPGGRISNPARFNVWHNSGYDARFAIVISDDKKNILADFEMPHIKGFPATLRSEPVEISFKRPATRKGSVRLSAVFPYAGSAGGRETLMEYPVKFPE
jgi:hypothetical protein